MDMLSFELSIRITKKLKKISELASEKHLFIRTLDEREREFIHRSARISTIGSSTRIENAVLTNTEIDWLDARLSQDAKTESFERHKKFIEQKLSRDRERSIEEVAGLRNVLEIIYAQAQELFPISETTLKGLHHELLRFYPPAHHYLGAYKTASNSVVQMAEGKVIGEILKTADPGPITATAMRELVDWYRQTLPEYPWSVAVMGEFVFRFLAIHPFQDGNGRLGRALFLLGLLHSPEIHLSAVMPYLAVDRHIEKHREEYYFVLRQCSSGKFHQDAKKYNFEPFLNFMLKMLENALLGDIDLYAKKYHATESLAPAPLKVLDCFRDHPERRLGTRDVVQKTQLPRPTAVYALVHLVGKGLLQKHGKGKGTRYQITF